MRTIGMCRKVSPRAAAVFAALIGMGALDAQAGVEIGIGADSPIDHRVAGVTTLSYLTDQRYPWEFAIGGISGRSTIDSHGGAPPTYYASISRRLQGAHWFISEGLAYDTANDWVLSGHWQFQTAIGYKVDHWTISARHLSNGGFENHNHGETFALVEYGF